MKKNIVSFERSMPVDRKEDRRTQRYSVKQDYPVFVSRMNKLLFNNKIQAVIKNISCDGIGLSFKNSVEPGTKVSLEILFHGCKFAVNGTIVHKRPFKDFFFYGVKIDGDARALREFIIAYESEYD